MRYTTLGLLGLAGMLAWAGSGQAQVDVRVPFVRVTVNPDPPPVVVAPPPPAPVVVVPPPGPVFVTPAPAPAVVPPAPAVVTRPQTPAEFAATFRPAAGSYSTVLLHPWTNAPVNVTFTLPPGAPRVSATRRDILFDYGPRRVHIVFGVAGGVRVRYVD
jgi:hypothetical protein